MSRIPALLVLLAFSMSAPAAASRITSALPDLTVTPGLLTIEGLDFGLQEGEVFLVVDATAVPLRVIPPWGDSLIIVELPDPPPAPGTYLLVIDPPEMPFAFFEASIGAVGPPGPQGDGWDITKIYQRICAAGTTCSCDGDGSVAISCGVNDCGGHVVSVFNDETTCHVNCVGDPVSVWVTCVRP